MTFAQSGLTRRQFSVGLVSLATATATRAMSETALPAIDTHAHVFRRGLKLAPGRRYAPDYDAPLSLYLEQLDYNGITNGVLTVGQGFDMGRPSILQTRVRKQDGKIVSAHVGGSCVQMMEGTFRLAGEG